MECYFVEGVLQIMKQLKFCIDLKNKRTWQIFALLLVVVFLLDIFIVPFFAVDTAQQWIADSFFSYIADQFEELVNTFASAFAFDFIGNFGPNMEFFYNALGGLDATENLFAVCSWFGIFIAFVLLAYNLIMPAFSMFFDANQGPFETLVRFVAACIMVLCGKSLIQVFLDASLLLWDKMAALNASQVDYADAIWNFLQPVIAPDLLGGFFALFNPLDLLCRLITPILAFILLKQLIKMIIEIVERYIILCFLYYCFPLGCCTIVSKGSSQIFKSYLRMIFCQIFLLFANLIAWNACINCLGNLNPFDSLLNFLFNFSLMKAFQRIDNYMRSMGLTVAQTSGNVLDAISASVSSGLANIANVSRTARIGQSAAKAFGSAIGNPMITNGGFSGRSDIDKMARENSGGINPKYMGSPAESVASKLMTDTVDGKTNNLGSVSSMVNNTPGMAAKTMENVFGKGAMSTNGLGNIKQDSVALNQDGSFSAVTDDGNKVKIAKGTTPAGTLGNTVSDKKGNNWNVMAATPIALAKGEELQFQTKPDGNYSHEQLASGLDMQKLGWNPENGQTDVSVQGVKGGYAVSWSNQEEEMKSFIPVSQKSDGSAKLDYDNAVTVSAQSIQGMDTSNATIQRNGTVKGLTSEGYSFRLDTEQQKGLSNEIIGQESNSVYLSSDTHLNLQNGEAVTFTLDDNAGYSNKQLAAGLDMQSLGYSNHEGGFDVSMRKTDDGGYVVETKSLAGGEYESMYVPATENAAGDISFDYDNAINTSYLSSDDADFSDASLESYLNQECAEQLNSYYGVPLTENMEIDTSRATFGPSSADGALSLSWQDVNNETKTIEFRDPQLSHNGYTPATNERKKFTRNGKVVGDPRKRTIYVSEKRSSKKK